MQFPEGFKSDRSITWAGPFPRRKGQLDKAIGILDSLLKDWDESKHARDEKGRFSSGASSSPEGLYFRDVVDEMMWATASDLNSEVRQKPEHWDHVSGITDRTWDIADRMKTSSLDLIKLPALEGRLWGVQGPADVTSREIDARIKATVADDLMQGWFGGSGGTSHRVYQDAAREVFGLEDAAQPYETSVREGLVGVGAGALTYSRDYPQAVVEDFLRAQYEATQAAFSEAGYYPDDTITMYRTATAAGVGLPEDAKPGDTAVANLRPLTSFGGHNDALSLMDYQESTYAAEDSAAGVAAPHRIMYQTDVPIKDIASLGGVVGMGDNFTEAVVLGTGPRKIEVVSGMQPSAAKADWDEAKHPRDERGRFGAGSHENFRTLAGTQVGNPVGEPLRGGGFNLGIQRVSLPGTGGETGVVKTTYNGLSDENKDAVIGGGPAQGLTYQQEYKHMIQAEVLASKIGEVIDAPTREVVHLGDGRLLSPYIEGDPWHKVALDPETVWDGFTEARVREMMVPSAITPEQMSDQAPSGRSLLYESGQIPQLSDRLKTDEARQSMGEVQLFNALINEQDADNAGNVMITQGNQLVSIDHASAFYNPPSEAKITDAIHDWDISPDRVAEVKDGIGRLLDSGTLTPWEQDKTQAIADVLSQVGKPVAKALDILNALLKDWDPEKHPRGADGRFGSGGGEAKHYTFTGPCELQDKLDEAAVKVRPQGKTLYMALAMKTPTEDLEKMLRMTGTWDKGYSGYEMQTRMAAVKVLQGLWFGDSGDMAHHVLQEAARAEFDLKDAAPTYKTDKPVFTSEGDSWIRNVIPEEIYRDYERTQYEVTQRIFQEAGFNPDDTIKAYRACRASTFFNAENPERGSSGEGVTRPLTSWATTEADAYQYMMMTSVGPAGFRSDTTVVASDVKVRDIASVNQAGWGAGDELVVLGGKREATLVDTSYQKALDILDRLIKEWDPDKHPRGADGRFGSGGSGRVVKFDRNELFSAAQALPYTPLPEGSDVLATRTTLLISQHMRTPADEIRATLSDIGWGNAFLEHASPEEIKAVLAERIRGYWFGDSGDTSHRDVQEAARAEFGLKDAASVYDTEDPNNTGRFFVQWDQIREDIPQSLIEDYLRAQYEVTQAAFQQMGFSPNDQVELYRAARASTVGLSPDAPHGEPGSGNLRPLTSWSIDWEQAWHYSESGREDSAIYKTAARISDVASTSSTGMGDSYSDEVLLLGGQRSVQMMQHDPQLDGVIKEWDESKHPRRPDGKFGSGDTESNVTYEEMSKRAFNAAWAIGEARSDRWKFLDKADLGRDRSWIYWAVAERLKTPPEELYRILTSGLDNEPWWLENRPVSRTTGQPTEIDPEHLTPDQADRARLDFVDNMRVGWFGSSGDTAHADYQNAAVSEFGLKDTAPLYEPDPSAPLTSRGGFGSQANIPQEVMQDFLRAQYETTQQVLSDAGFKSNDTVTLWRSATAEGLGQSSKPEPGTEITTSFRPLVGWGSGPFVSQFSGLGIVGPWGESERTVYSAKVPIKDIASLGGYGGMGDVGTEAVVLGDPRTITVRTRADAENSSWIDKALDILDRLIKEFDESKHPRQADGRFGTGGEDSGLVDASGKVTPAGWDEWAFESPNINDVMHGKDITGAFTSDGARVTEQDAQEFKRLGEAIQREAESTTLPHTVVWRGDSFNTVQDLYDRYTGGKVSDDAVRVSLDRLTSGSPDQGVALEYSGQNTESEEALPVQALVRFENGNGVIGTMTETTMTAGIPMSERDPEAFKYGEAVLPEGSKYSVRIFEPGTPTPLGVFDQYLVDCYSAQKVKNPAAKALDLLDGLLKDWDESKHPRDARGRFGSGTSDGLPADFAKRSGKKSPIGDAGSPDQTEEKINDRLNDKRAYPHVEESASNFRALLEGRHVCLNIPGRCLADLLRDDQRFKSQFETGRSGGHFNPDLRARAETFMFGYGECEPEMRPVYGFLLKDPDRYSRSSADYGDVRVVFKDDVRGRTTTTFGDSLKPDPQDCPIPCRLDETDPRRLAAADALANTTRVSVSKMYPDRMSPERQREIETDAFLTYTEAQIHGGVSIKDVDHVILPAEADYLDDITPLLDKAGVKWQTWGPEEEKTI